MPKKAKPTATPQQLAALAVCQNRPVSVRTFYALTDKQDASQRQSSAHGDGLYRLWGGSANEYCGRCIINSQDEQDRTLKLSGPSDKRDSSQCDYQVKWESVIPVLRNYKHKSVDFLSITGDAPKDFITDSEYREGHRSRRQRQESYIAKIGSKFYPNE